MTKDGRLKSLAAMLSLRGAIAIACFVSVGSGITGILLEHSAKSRATETGALVADEVSASVRNEFDRSIGTVEGMRSAIVAARSQNIVDRNAHNMIMLATLKATPDLLATWTAWEPNAFDGHDADFANTQGHDATGRFVPYWHRSGSAIALSPLEDYTKAGAGDYYLRAQQSGKPVMVEPYSYTVEGRSVLMTSIALPVLDKGRPIAVVGGDMALDDLQKRIAAMKLPFDGQVLLKSGKGIVIFSKDKALLGKKSEVAKGETENSVVTDPALGDVIRVERPVTLKGFDAGWTVRIELPLTAVLADARLAELSLLLSALAMIVGLALVLRATAVRVVGRPLETLSDEMKALAAGNLAAPTRDPAKAVEIAQMRDAIDVFRDNAIAKRQADQDQEMVVSSLADSLQGLADGDLASRITATFSGTYQQIKTNFNNAMERLEGAMSAVSGSVTDVRHGSDEIRSASDNLARRTEQQAAGLEEVASAMRQITTGVGETAASALKASSVVDESKRDMENGGVVIRRAIDAMGGIEVASNEISDIISVIDGIAFQTNLLALNAGVEAARAGEAGKGFAVVASEVRALALRSSDAAQDIKSKILASSNQVKSGVALVGEMNQALDRIIGRISEISSLASSIARSADEQSTSLNEVNGAVAQMDTFTQQNAAMVEESTAAARNLASQAGVLANLIGQFRISGHGASTGSVVPMRLAS
ncbi:MAG TPA: methyl-accepting chemotaxis protein [Sphingobium sp.]|uniref:methyl-accepting chemotaxis protein n=1 Tax=Sphingobium sp. TaxID=1912891 RepID=UPI002ED00F26